MLVAAFVLLVGGTFLGLVLFVSRRLVSEGVVLRAEEATKKVENKINDITQL